MIHISCAQQVSRDSQRSILRPVGLLLILRTFSRSQRPPSHCDPERPDPRSGGKFSALNRPAQDSLRREQLQLVAKLESMDAFLPTVQYPYRKLKNTLALSHCYTGMYSGL